MNLFLIFKKNELQKIYSEVEFDFYLFKRKKKCSYGITDDNL